MQKCIEFYAGIGGFSEALKQENLNCSVISLEQSKISCDVLKLNFKNHQQIMMNLEHLTLEQLRNWNADFWWLSPPCQPYTVKGVQKDLLDPRAVSFQKILKLLKEMPPQTLILENVIGFQNSKAHQYLQEVCSSLGYNVNEFCLCPSDLGAPMRRSRYYFVASLNSLKNPIDLSLIPEKERELAFYIDKSLTSAEIIDLKVSQKVLKFREGFRILEGKKIDEYTTCFTSSYGKAHMRSGSYLRLNDQEVRYFSPNEILRLMGFSDNFVWPDQLSNKKKWQLIGNSLSVHVVRRLIKMCYQG